MALTEEGLGSFGQLARAIGLTTATGTNSAWFTEPVGGTSNPAGLKTILSSPDQREALLAFVDDALGPPEGRSVGTQQWIPLFQNHQPSITVYAVVEALTGSVRVGVGVEHSTGDVAPNVASRLHLPLVQLPNGDHDDRTASDSEPKWLLLGQTGGVIDLEIDATFTSAAPQPGEAHLGGARARLGIPTSPDDDLEFALDLVDLQVPGATAPTTQTLDLDSLATVGQDVVEFVVGLVRAQAAALDLNDPTFRHIAGLTGILGLRDVGTMPPFPIADLPTQGVGALVGWFEQVLGDGTNRDLWIGELARLVGGTPDPTRDAVSIDLGDVSLVLGVRVDASVGGHSVLVPWAEVDYATTAGASAGGGFDVVRIDTGTGQVQVLPQVRLEAVFGADSAPNAPKLITSGPVKVGSVHVGVRLDDLARPQFALSLHDVDLTVSGAPHHYDVLDLSSPDAALAAADDVVDGAISDALDALGVAGDLVRQLIGVAPPGGISALKITDLIQDPLAALRRYYQDLVASTSAMETLLASVQSLLVGTGAVGGNGSLEEPWRVTIAPVDGGSGVGLAVWRDGDHLVVAAAADLSTSVLDGIEVASDLRIVLLDFDRVGGGLALAPHAFARVLVRSAGQTPATLSLGVADVEFHHVGLEVGWRAGAGLSLGFLGDGLSLLIPELVSRGPGGTQAGATPLRVGLPLPVVSGSTITWTPDWDGIEMVLGRLLLAAEVPVLDLAVDALGWNPSRSLAITGTTGPRLGLAALMADPAAAITTWAAAIALECRHVEWVMNGVAKLLSGGALTGAVGLGTAEYPYRAPIAGVVAAPAVVAWTEPPCPPLASSFGGDFGLLDGLAVGADGELDAIPVGETVAAALRRAAVSVPGLGDLLFARSGLGAGFDQLVDRWTGTDGVTGPAASLPNGVESVVLPGCGFAELAAIGRSSDELVADLGVATTAIAHVGCDSTWGAGYPTSDVIDATGGANGSVPPSALVTGAGPGAWFVRLATPRAAGATRGDHDGVAGQAALLAEVLGHRTDPIVVVAYGAAAAAALRAAQSVATMSAVVTVGAPWLPISVTGLQSGLSGDALTLLKRLLPAADATAEAMPDALLALQSWPAIRGLDLVMRSIAVAGPTDLPSAGAETRRDGLVVRAVFGTLSGTDASAALVTIVADAIRDRAEAAVEATADSSSPEPEHLHLGVDVPALTADLGGLTVGAGVRIELVHLAPPAAPADPPTLEVVREVVVSLDLGVTDGWLVGGPGAADRDVEARWAQARVHVPISIGGAPAARGYTEIVLHDAKVFAADRVRWVIRADGQTDLTGDLAAATTALPEVKILIGQMIGRLQSAAPSLTAVIEALGLVRNGGLDPDGLDRLLFDPGALVRPLIDADAASLAAAINTLVGAAVDAERSPTAIDLGVAEGQLRVDLAARTVTGTTTVTNQDMPQIGLALDLTPTGATAEVSVGSIDPALGGVALHVRAATGTGVAVHLDHRGAAGATAPPTIAVALLPTPDLEALGRFAATLVPATLLQAVLSGLRATASAEGRATIEAALDALGLLGSVDTGTRPVLLPFGLVSDPTAWLAQRADPLTTTVALLDALAPIVAPDRGANPGWPIDPAFAITYEVVAGRLEIAAHLHVDHAVDTVAVAADITAGLAVSLTAPPQPIVDAQITLDGWGTRLRTTPQLSLELVRPTPATAIEIYPGGAGLGSLLSDVGTSLLPVVLNGIADHRHDVGPDLAKDVGAAVYEIGDAMGLMEGPSGTRTFTAPLITAFVANPSSLVGQLPALVSAGLDALVHALAGSGSAVTTSLQPNSVRRFSFGPTGEFHLDLGGDPAHPFVDLGGAFDLKGGNPNPIGRVVIEHLRLTPSGVQIDVQVGPVQIELGSMVLRPMAIVRAGIADGTFTRLISLGVALDDDGARSVEIRWAVDGTAPVPYAITRSGSGESPDATLSLIALDLVAVAVSVASGIVAEGLADVLSPDAVARLQGVVFTGGVAQIDPTFVTDLLEPGQLLERLKILAWNCASDPNPLSITIDQTVTIALASNGGQLGLSVTLAPGKTLAFPTSGINVVLEVDAAWVDPAVPPGLTVYVLRGATPTTLVPEFGFSVAGLGVRFTKTSGPLLELGAIALDGIAVHVYGEASAVGVGGGARIQLSGLAVAPGGGGGGNGMANSLVNDAGSAGANNRPSFSPSLAIQKHPGHDVAVGLSAGDPPGPWWIVVQRQLGPIYVERIGFDSVEANGKVTRISLLFSGSVSLFGLTAAVDQLSLSWNGGDVLSISSWSADLMGLAVSADIAGASLAGGLLKSVDEHGVVSYVGMLVGRFATYGLSVFGGYASDPEGHASFFVFGAVVGPIGGPPAFFITGLGGGLGINRGLVIPDDLSRFGDYPFIQALDPAASVPDPMDELKKLNIYFPHQPGNFWFAAGISFNSFALVDGVAVVAVSFGNGLEINLLGLARMALPRPGVALVSIELALLARFSTVEGVFMMKAQLTDNSWLLYEDIRLTGGFAFAFWWKGPLSGQFVLSMGGYHPDFHRDGYPDVPRLGLVWKVSDAIVMKGESYFALTSEALMAGTGVSVSVDFGWVWAKLEFGADGIVYFDPFFFDVSAYCRISAGIDIDLGLFSISMSLTLGASIHVWGPDFAGEVTFEIGPCDVPISFGPQHQQPGVTISWADFVAKYLEDAGGGTARALSSITGRGTLPTSTGGAQGAPSADGSADLPFQVFAEFEISFTTTIPTTAFHIGAATRTVPATLSNGAGAQMGLAPMGAGNLVSTLAVTLSRRSGGTWVDVPEIAKLAANLIAGQPTADGSRTTTDAFPTGVWGPTKSLDTAVKPIPSGDVLVTGNRVILVAGIDTKTQGPEIDYYQVTSDRRPLPLQAVGNDRSKLLAAAGALPVIAPTTADEALRLARETLFAPLAAASLGAPPSAFGRAAYANDRVAPPRFGTLTDGLAKQNGADGQREPLAPPEDAAAPSVRRPFLAGYLSAGAGAAAATATTTVADGRIKRRPAPTTDSVRGRLGLHIPAVLHQVSPPAVIREGTLVASLAMPRTDVLNATRTIASGPVGRSALAGTIGGIDAPPASALGPLAVAPGQPRRRGQARADSDPSRIGSGDLVVLQSPDARIDTSERRPHLDVGGRARVVVLTPHGVVHDDDVTDSSVEIAAGATTIAVQADGDADALGGCSGWHERSRVALIASRAAVAAGATIVVEGRGSDEWLGWSTASSLTTRASQITTRFTRTIRTLAVALTGVAPRNLDHTQIHLVGGGVDADGEGNERPPMVVTLGATTVLVYGVTPDEGATNLSVVIDPGAAWVVTAVIAAGGPNEAAVSQVELAEQLAHQGLVASTAGLTAIHGGGCTAQWRVDEATAPDGSGATPRTAAVKKAAAKKAPAQKTPAKQAPLAQKTAAKKAPVKKTAAKKAPAQKTAAKKAPAKKAAAKKTAAKKAPAKKTAAKKALAKRAPARTTATRRTPASRRTR